MDGTHVALERILGGQEKPDSLDLQILRYITGNFSDDRRIGKGGCGEVFKGILPNGFVAVKRLLNCHTVDEKMFRRELDRMIEIEHENIVRFLGYCSETKYKRLEIDGKTVMAEERERLLCFEYIRNGSLDNYVTDELRGLEWHTRYQIIKGICSGLLHLHKEKLILHMDLKPANILLGDQMLPKITDFGLATLDGKSQTTGAQHLFSPGYCAPEYIIDNSKRSPKADIYSLGVIIIELVTGSKEMPNTTKVLRRWRHRWNKSSKHTPLWYHQVKKCLELAVCCKRKDPINRPHIWEVIRELNKIDGWDADQNKAATEASLEKIISGLDDMLGIEPLEFDFHLAHKEQVSFSIELTNDTDDYLAFRIATTSLLPFSIQPEKDIAAPRSKCRTTIALPAQQMSLLHNDFQEEIIVQSTKVGGGLTTMNITDDMFNDEGGDSQKKNDEVDKMVDQVTIFFNIQLLRDEHHQETAKESSEPNVNAEMGSLRTSSQEVQQSMELLTLHGPKDSSGDVGGKLVHSLAFTEDELMLATAEILGKSTYGTTYKATLEDGSLVAVKRLRENLTKGHTEFQAEVAALGRIRHPNLLALRAYYLGPKGEKLLVFDYMPKASLSAFLHARAPDTPVDWATRMRIAKGTARGLAYLHDDMNIIHGNLTAMNVLLDEDHNPKISDLGLSHLMTVAANSSVLAAAGALGYLAPEVSKLKKASAKTDVYSLGVLVLELLTGKSPADESTNGMNLPQWVASIVKECTSKAFDLELMRDAAAGDELVDTLKLALQCVDPAPAARPEAREVLRQLKQIRRLITRRKGVV